MILRRFRSLVGGLRFLVINLKAFTQLPPFSERSAPGGMTFRGCRSREVGKVLVLRKQLDGHDFSWTVRLLLTLIPGKCCVVICDKQGSLNALSLFYFNERDILDTTLHEGFIGVKADFTGRGLATCIRRLAADHFSETGTIMGISSRITLSNSASVSSGYKAGYALVDSYHDESTGEERGYFVNRFRHEVRE